MKKNDEDLEVQLAEADHRRKALESERIKNLLEVRGLDKIEKAYRRVVVDDGII